MQKDCVYVSINKYIHNMWSNEMSIYESIQLCLVDKISMQISLYLVAMESVSLSYIWMYPCHSLWHEYIQIYTLRHRLHWTCLYHSTFCIFPAIEGSASKGVFRKDSILVHDEAPPVYPREPVNFLFFLWFFTIICIIYHDILYLIDQITDDLFNMNNFFSKYYGPW